MTAEKDRKGAKGNAEAGDRRRTFFRVFGGLLAGSLLARGFLPGSRAGADPSRKVVIGPECTACMGCAAACPVNAILILPAGPSVSAPECIRCGYCVAACPVGAAVLSRES